MMTDNLDAYVKEIHHQIEIHPQRKELEILWGETRIEMATTMVKMYAESHNMTEDNFTWSPEEIKEMLEMDLMMAKAMIDMGVV